MPSRMMAALTATIGRGGYRRAAKSRSGPAALVLALVRFCIEYRRLFYAIGLLAAVRDSWAGKVYLWFQYWRRLNVSASKNKLKGPVPLPFLVMR